MLKWRISLATRVRFFKHSVIAAAVSSFFFVFKFQLEKNVFIYFIFNDSSICMRLNFVNYRIISEITVNRCTMTFNNKYDKEY